MIPPDWSVPQGKKPRQVRTKPDYTQGGVRVCTHHEAGATAERRRLHPARRQEGLRQPGTASDA